MGRKVTAQDVAGAAGVSASTVDRVLNHRGGVDSAKEARVLAAARRLGLDRALDLRPARTLRVAVFIQGPQNPFHAALKRAIDAWNRGPDPWNLQMRVFHVAPSLTSALIEKVAEAGRSHDAIVICLPHDDRLVGALQTILRDGKPVVALATDLCCPGILYVGPDNRQAGRVAGDMMGRLLGASGGDLLVIAGHSGMVGHAQRIEGFAQVLAERHPACRIMRVAESLDRADLAGEIAWRALREEPLIRGIYNAAVGAMSVAEALQRLNRAGDVVLITHELTPDRRELLRTGILDVVIDQDPEAEIAETVLVIAHAYGRTDQPPRSGPTPLRIHMRENC